MIATYFPTSEKRLVAFAVSMLSAIMFIMIFSQSLFALTKVGALSLYFMIWWITLFLTLPLNVKSQSETGVVVEGSEPGAPQAPLMLTKAILTTWLSVIVFACAAWGLIWAGF
jgi:predicted secreted protein